MCINFIIIFVLYLLLLLLLWLSIITPSTNIEVREWKVRKEIFINNDVLLIIIKHLQNINIIHIFAKYTFQLIHFIIIICLNHLRIVKELYRYINWKGIEDPRRVFTCCAHICDFKYFGQRYTIVILSICNHFLK